MTTWNNIVKTATLGTNRIPWQSVATEEWLGDFAKDKEEGEANLLRKAGVLTIARKAGYIPQKITYTSSKVAAEEIQDYISLPMQQYFKQIEQAKLYEEWTTLVFQAKKIIHPELLPQFLETAINLKLEEEQVEAVIGKRGKWLAGQHQEWSTLLTVKAEKWEIGTFDERFRYFKSVRKRDAAEARELLENTIADESINHLAKFLHTFQWNLSQADEAFLTPLLTHRRKEIREVVVQLLSNIPESALVERMKERLAGLLLFSKKWLGLTTDLAAKLPPKCTEEMQQDGINPNFTPKKMGKKAGYLMQMLSMVPPKHWETITGWEIPKIITTIKNNEWAKPILLGIAYAAINYKNRGWGTEILAQLLEEEELREILDGNFWVKLVNVADENKVNQLIQTYLEHDQHDFSDKLSANPAYVLISGFTKIDESTTLCFLNKLKTAVEKDRANKRSKSQLHPPIYQLKILAFDFPPTPTVMSALMNWDCVKHQRWMEDHLAKAQQLLDFRYRLRLVL